MKVKLSFNNKLVINLCGAEYENPLGPQYEVCDYERSPSNRSVTSCSLEVSEWEPCTSRSGYGYNAAQPCVFIKLNKVHDL